MINASVRTLGREVELQIGRDTFTFTQSDPWLLKSTWMEQYRLITALERLGKELEAQGQPAPTLWQRWSALPGAAKRWLARLMPWK